MAKISIYLSKSSSSEEVLKYKKYLKESLFRHRVTFHRPSSLDEINETLSKELMKESVDYVFAMGGDGTIHQFIQMMCGTKVPLLIIPTGTANDLARELSLSSKIEHAVRTFLDKKIESIDLISVNKNLMSTCGGLGISSEVAGKINELRVDFPWFKKIVKVIGPGIYPIILSIYFLRKLKLHRLQIISNDFPGLSNIQEASMVMINNQSILGKSFVVAPGTVNTDGKFNVTIFKHKNKVSLIKAVIMIGLGKKDLSDKNLTCFETKNIEINCLGKKLSFFGDGEVIERSENFSITSVDKSLKVFKSSNSAFSLPVSLDEVSL